MTATELLAQLRQTSDNDAAAGLAAALRLKKDTR